MNKIINFKKIVFISFFAAFLAVFLLAGPAQAGFWDWFKLNKTDNYSRQTAAIVTATTAPSAPSNISATAGKCNSGIVDLSWTDNSRGSAHFTIIRVGGALGGKNASAYQAKKGQSSYSITNVKGDMGHKFYIAACSNNLCSDLVGSDEINPTKNCSSANYSITVSASGSGSGTIIGKLGGNEIINCGTDCFEDNITYNKTEKIILTATPKTGSVFSKWEGDSECNNITSNICQISRTKNHNGLKAKFSKKSDTSDKKNTVALNISKNGNGSGSIQLNNRYESCDLSSSCSFDFEKDKNVFITIIPDNDSKIVSASGGIINFDNSYNDKCALASNKNSKKDCYIKMTGNKNITINFSAKNQADSGRKYNLAIKNTGSVSGLAALLDVDNNVYIKDLSDNQTCTAGANGGKCKFSVESGHKVKILVYASLIGYSADWSNANCSNNGTQSSKWQYCELTMSDSDKEIEVKFTK